MVRVFANGPGDLGSIPGWVILKSQKMVLEQSRKRRSALPLPIEKGDFGSPSTMLANFTLELYIYMREDKQLDRGEYIYEHRSKTSKSHSERRAIAEHFSWGQLEHIYSSSVRIWDVALKTCQRQWTIGKSGERGSEISVLAVQNDDDIYTHSSHFVMPLMTTFY